LSASSSRHSARARATPSGSIHGTCAQAQSQLYGTSTS
jgi:hypothetical protein